MSDHDQPVAANLLDRQFEAAAPNQRWVGDTTEFVSGFPQAPHPLSFSMRKEQTTKNDQLNETVH